jgi:putative MFS transporter
MLYFAASMIKLFININYMIVYAFTAEIYDTKLRGTGTGFNNAVGRIGGAIMPWISYLFFYFGLTGPFLAQAVICLLSIYASV